ncbi:putative bifunctional inhibitor/plant lipid transfer protein/seed storage helical [Helianthus annuus]|uniref:Bifunctional inhibitor/plant lipid transfer protein/seed storage helical n=1 Tax=Helianthus annuus TaxID=4232 RepID=A0A251RPC7_HELAN|nr:14 kDa proline-rich protein DC2.15 [Helianthus annuus]KAF5755300.1 putative bifunctional inhibitor/plant lipid transfer protein/seed storage helical [Helianthus annuus]KAJ0429036.1 putative bifunctional inhibitor/plant lipid transfer protein/seed storage helical [Helianthus annuus]KAJ0433306.1 putative bifunctional inhibitor/plant lipid transfer protein/seed storage helical [Helianthus annuus]KAJ0447393.1 putative bifunctional inhibitor/plant lipid transfer protein/seed storage helical [Heli
MLMCTSDGHLHIDICVPLDASTFGPKRKLLHLYIPFKPFSTFTNHPKHKGLIFSHIEMASNSNASLVFFLALNVLFFAMVSGCGTCGSPAPKPAPEAKATCPKDTLKLGVCANLLGLISVEVGSPPTKPCCNLIKGLADLEAAVCLCTAIKANVLGNDLNVPVALTLLLNVCGKKAPDGFKCE